VAPKRAVSPVVAELALHIRRNLAPRPALVAAAA
jgi:hypothetical protein